MKFLAFRASPSVWCITRMIRAMEQIRRMRGGAQSHLMRCSDGKDHNLYFVVKFQNNPQHARVLVNELLGNRIARRMGLPVPRVEVVKVDPDLIRWTPALCIEMPRSSTPCCPGLQFGSCHPGDPRRMTLHDFLPDELLREVKNIHDFAGMLVFDKWTCNTNGRQTLFYREIDNGHGSPGGNGHRTSATSHPTSYSTSPTPGASPTDTTMEGKYSTVMIDQGFCFNAGEWNYPDAPLRGVFGRNDVYACITSWDTFEPWLSRIESFPESSLWPLAEEIPPEWYGGASDELERLLTRLLTRRERVR